MHQTEKDTSSQGKCWAWMIPVVLAAGECGLRVRHQRSAVQDDSLLRPETRRLLSSPELWRKWRVVVLGDSIVHGMELPEEQTFPYLIQRHLQTYTNCQDVVVINAGIPGNTSLHGLQRLQRDVIRFQPHITLISFGLNDANLRRRPQDAWLERELLPRGMGRLLHGLHIYRTARCRLRRLAQGIRRRPPFDWNAPPEPAPRISPPAFRAALTFMVHRIQRATSSQIFLLTIHPVRPTFLEDEGWRQRQEDILRHYNAIVRSVAGRTGVGLIDIEQLLQPIRWEDILDADGVHLTARGQAVLADIISDALITMGAVDSCLLGIPV
ncbi:MAG: SGNH/GDSL hydrolase family protein [Anaerolineae bacterium]